MNPAIEAQARIRRNAEEESNALNDFSVWETTIKQNDAKIKKAAQSSKIRSSTLLGKCDNRVFENESFSKVNSEISTPVLAGRSNSIVIGGQQQVVQSKNPVARAPKEAIENDKPAISEDALEENERQLGNTLFSSRDYQGSIKHYTKSIQLNPSSMLSYSNRAMAHLKLKDWRNAESDASSAIKIDELHIKSYQRRSVARLALGKIRSALKDLYLANAALTKTKAMSVGNDPKKQRMSQDINTSQIEAELRKVIKSAPKRRVHIQIRKKTTCKLETSSVLHAAMDICEAKPSTQHNCPPVVDKVSRNVRHNSMQNIKSWLEFEQIWKSLQTFEKVECLVAMKPSKLVEIYKNGIEDSDLLLDLLYHCSKMKKRGMKYISAISKIPSIDMVVMMMSKTERNLIHDYIEEVVKWCSKKVDPNVIKNDFGI